MVLALRLPEYKSKTLFHQYGIKTPKGFVVTKDDFISNRLDCSKFSIPAAVKAQNIIGGRGKAGGIRICQTIEEVVKNIEDLFQNGFSGNVVEEILIEELISIDREAYISISIDRRAGNFALMASSSGGIEIEATDPAEMRKIGISNLIGLQKYQVLYVATQLTKAGAKMEEAQELIRNLYKLQREEHALLVEINPLAIQVDGSLVAADAKIIIDDNARGKNADKDTVSIMKTTPLQVVAKELGVNMVELAGDIAVISNGAGEGMTTLDQIVKAGGSLSLWIDLGGGALSARPEVLDDFIMKVMDTQPRVLLFTAFFQIGRCDLFAESFRNIYLKRKSEPDSYVPHIILRLDGRNAEQAKAFSEGTNIMILDSSQDACEAAAKLSMEGV